MRRACAGLFLIPTPVFGVDSTPRMGGWDGAIWDDFSSWTCPFPVGDMDRPLSLNLLSPTSPNVMCLRATRCICVYCEKGMPS